MSSVSWRSAGARAATGLEETQRGVLLEESRNERMWSFRVRLRRMLPQDRDQTRGYTEKFPCSLLWPRAQAQEARLSRSLCSSKMKGPE